MTITKLENYHNWIKKYPNKYLKLKNLRQKRYDLKLEVLFRYSNGSMKCANPFGLHHEDVTDVDVLELDHINGNGAEERRQLFGSNGSTGGTNFYRWLKNNKFPDGYQVLCRNCQKKKTILNHENNSYNYKNTFGKKTTIEDIAVIN